MKESQLDNKTAIATNDYVRIVDENNNSVKIKKDSFMAAIRDALPSIISDGETGGGSVLSIINGALKTRTDANLASVLGVNSYRIQSGDDFNTMTNNGIYYTDSNATAQSLINRPIFTVGQTNSGSFCMRVTTCGGMIFQFLYSYWGKIAMRVKQASGLWVTWILVRDA